MIRANYGDWLTENHYDYAVRPMKNLLNEMVQAFDLSNKVTEFLSFSVTNWVNFGIFEDNEGVTEQIFDDFMSGVELNIQLPIKRGNCKNLKNNC